MFFAKISQTTVILVAFTKTLAQDVPDEVPNPAVDLLSCQDLSCDPSGDSICASGDSSGPEVGIVIAAEAIEIGSNTLSLTVINGLEENGFTGIGSDKYEHWDQQLFVGISPDLDDDDYPSGCVLMMQYLGQTFPEEDLPDEDTRSDSAEGTTSCDGVVDPFCQSAISDIIQSFNVSEADEDERCELLTQHVSSRLSQNAATCGDEGTWIANFINVTGGPLPGPDTSTPNNERLGGDCRPVMPQDYQLYHVVNMRQFLFPDPPDAGSDFYGSIFGGRSGFTPVVTVTYDGNADEDRSRAQVQFSCMKTFERDGDAPEGPFESGASFSDQSHFLMAIIISILIMAMAL